MRPMPWGELAVLMWRAGEVILLHWRADAAVRLKTNESLVTAVDLAAHHILEAGLRALTPDIPMLSEEDCEIPLSERDHWRRWRLVDPLGNTKEFISGSERFTVNVALAEDGRVLFGLINVPVSGRCYYGGAGLGAWCEEADGDAQPISVHLEPEEAFIVMANKRHDSPAQERLLNGLSEHLGDLWRAGIGGSLESCLLAESVANRYPHLTPTSRWDTAAAQGVLEGANGEMLGLYDAPFTYEPHENYPNGSFLALPHVTEWRSELIQLTRTLH